ncbi:GNAT family N-acetyltransferase [Streptomyces sp. ISL-36]|uniref:GNAT family N-acetyltransferase n=1 Tax=Streptomyces sp. ISL-36 TaxID=2819182 RepID=UPI001BE597B7|nr:GNAT family N-acetyltransferase [Streptomyces sp. ISL-36]MBT2440944.1 GNAT family N-acetyltransferase [Streptomyces sp. ISL-36]
MHYRPMTERDLDAVLAWDVKEPVVWIDADRYREETAARQCRPEWTWLAEEDGRILARGLWWGRSDSERPITLDCLSVHPSVTDPVTLAAELLTAAHAAFAEQGATTPPKYNIMLPQDDGDEESRAAAAAWREEAAKRAGLTERIQRLRFEWVPENGTPERSDRLVFTAEPDDEAFVEVFRQVSRGSLDSETLANVADMGEEAAARDDLEFYLSCPGKREWWRLAHTPDGRLAGFAIPSRTPYSPNVGYLGVVPELRGQRYIDDVLGEITRFHAGEGAERITATTDSTNVPMANAFRRGGYRVSEIRVILASRAA